MCWDFSVCMNLVYTLITKFGFFIDERWVEFPANMDNWSPLVWNIWCPILWQSWCVWNTDRKACPVASSNAGSARRNLTFGSRRLEYCNRETLGSRWSCLAGCSHSLLMTSRAKAPEWGNWRKWDYWYDCRPKRHFPRGWEEYLKKYI